MPILSLGLPGRAEPSVPWMRTAIASQKVTASESLRSVSRPIKAAVFGTEIAVAAALVAWQAPRLDGDLAVFVFLLGLNVLAGFMTINIYGATRISIGVAFALTLIVLFGVPGAVILAPVGAVGRGIGRRKVDFEVLTNAAFLTLVYAGSAASYELIADVGPDNPSLLMVAGGAVATVVSFTLNATLVAINRRLRDNLSFHDFLEQHAWLPPYYIAMGLVGITLAAAYDALGLVGVMAFLTPAVMMRLAIKQYVDKTAENVEKLKQQNTALQHANVEIQRVSDELRLSYDGTLEALVNALDARDQETKGHSIRVSHYMMDIAREMGINEGTQEWTDMQRGSLLHDVGKIGISDTILLKPAKLTEDEWELMRRHPEIGYNMLRQVHFLQGPAEIILSHHERWDGQGYPRGLREKDIPLGARIFTVVDTFDSMTSDRPYRKSKSTLEAMNEILRCSGTQFDPLIVEAFLDIYEKWVVERDMLHGLVTARAA
jgi:putative nucleotidyltransferase with HDIG domain